MSEQIQPHELLPGLIRGMVLILGSEYGGILERHLRAIWISENDGELVVVLWMSDRWSYGIMTGKRVLHRLWVETENCSRYVMELDRPSRLVVGRLNQRRKRG